MQKDDEVGKVAQATPVLICEFVCRGMHYHTDYYLQNLTAKALEMFMATLVTETAKVSQERSAKRVEVWHL